MNLKFFQPSQNLTDSLEHLAHFDVCSVLETLLLEPLWKTLNQPIKRQIDFYIREIQQ